MSREVNVPNAELPKGKLPNNRPKKGLFITLEGGEGSGKSTQIRALKRWLVEVVPKTELVISREPGGTPSAEAIRQLLVTGAADSLTAKTEALLMLASRVEHVERLIGPALARGAIVICDRFSDSSFVYQTIADTSFDIGVLRDLHNASIGNFVPDITFLLDLAPEEGLERAGAREDQIEARFESKGLAFHQQVSASYKALAAAESNRFSVIDATQSEDKIFAVIQSQLAPFLSRLNQDVTSSHGS